MFQNIETHTSDAQSREMMINANNGNPTTNNIPTTHGHTSSIFPLLGFCPHLLVAGCDGKNAMINNARLPHGIRHNRHHIPERFISCRRLTDTEI